MTNSPSGSSVERHQGWRILVIAHTAPSDTGVQGDLNVCTLTHVHLAPPPSSEQSQTFKRFYFFLLVLLKKKKAKFSLVVIQIGSVLVTGRHPGNKWFGATNAHERKQKKKTKQKRQLYKKHGQYKKKKKKLNKVKCLLEKKNTSHVFSVNICYRL